MAGGGTTKTTTGPSNPEIDKTITQILGGVQSELTAGPKVFNQSLFSPAGSTTQQGWLSALGAANNPAYGGAVNDALGYNKNLIQNGGLTSGQQNINRGYGDLSSYYDAGSPGATTLRNNIADDTTSNINSIFSNSGRFGGGSHVSSLGEGLGSALAGFDSNMFDKAYAAHRGSLDAQAGMEQQGVNNAAGASAALPGIFQSSMLPSATINSVGAEQDANSNAILQGQNDLFRRQNDAKQGQYGWASSVLAGNAGAGGQTTTSPTPAWWQQLLGAGAIGSGIYKNIWGA